MILELKLWYQTDAFQCLISIRSTVQGVLPTGGSWFFSIKQDLQLSRVQRLHLYLSFKSRHFWQKPHGLSLIPPFAIHWFLKLFIILDKLTLILFGLVFLSHLIVYLYISGMILVYYLWILYYLNHYLFLIFHQDLDS